MVVQTLRHGAKSLPVCLRLGAELIRNQGLSGTAGFVAGFRRPGRREGVVSKHFWTRPSPGTR